MQNPWLTIPIADYEAHMASAPITQAQMLASQFESALKRYQPKSVAVFGCAGGNGFERIDRGITQRIVAIDINADYVEICRERFASCFSKLEMLVADVQSPSLNFDPVDLIYAGLIFEYTDAETVIKNASRLLTKNGKLVSVLQLPDSGEKNVSRSAYESLGALEAHMHLVSPKALCDIAEQNRFTQTTSMEITLASTRKFQLQTFQKL
ncbi:MAG: hypothetical protein RL020_628 [Pseudomonadota bacterium]|jgi:SAM-dependent methyltransferase